jgi:fructokinase
MKVVAFGELLWDVIEGKYLIGGAPLNFAAHCIQCNMPAALISAYGNDELGRLTLEEVRSLHVGTSLLQKAHKHTGTVPVRLVRGQPQYHIVEDVAYDFIDHHKIDYNALEEYDCFYFGTLAQRHEVSRKSLHRILESCAFKHIFFDVNLRQHFYERQILEYSLGKCSMLKLNDEEVVTLSELLFSQSLGLKAFTEKITEVYPNIKVVILTRGKDGCLVRSAYQTIEMPAPTIELKDAVGAGDAFSAAFCASYFQTGDLRLATQQALKVGAFVASEKGAIPFFDDQLLK